jgi:hypothetical protein
MSDNPSVTLPHKEQATRLLSYMCFYSSKNQEVIGTQAVVVAIVANMALDSKRLQYYSEGLIWSLAHNSKKRRNLLINAGAVPAVTAVPSPHYSFTLTSSAHCVVLCVRDQLTQSTSEAVSKGAAWAMKALVKK